MSSAMDRDPQQKLLFTPGPLNTGRKVKEQMLLDWGSRDTHFIGVVKNIRSELLSIVC
jgi:2-aminoethylphosphonate-pyruvate transaminase